MVSRGHCDSVASRRDTVRTNTGMCCNTIPDLAGLAPNGSAKYIEKEKQNGENDHDPRVEI